MCHFRMNEPFLDDCDIYHSEVKNHDFFWVVVIDEFSFVNGNVPFLDKWIIFG